MCGRYNFTAEQMEDFWKAARDIAEQIKERLKTGEIYPTNLAPVLIAENGQERATAMT